MTITALFLAAFMLLQADSAERDKSVLDARTFAVERSPEGDRITESSRVPYRPGVSCFEWVLLLAPREDARNFRELLELPGVATDWSSVDEEAPPATVSDDGSSATVEHRLEAGQSELGSSWCIAPGDPLGTYHVTVREGDRVIHRFDFQIVVDENELQTI